VKELLESGEEQRGTPRPSWCNYAERRHNSFEGVKIIESKDTSIKGKNIGAFR